LAKSLFQNEYKIIKEAFQNGRPKDYIVQLFSMRDEVLRNREDPVKILQSLSNDLSQKPAVQCEFLGSTSDRLCQTLQTLTRHAKLDDIR
jgi:hypothetical protein